MTDDCVFCAIVDGELPSRDVYEDDDVLAFLDANPLAPGHTVVIPKAHHERLGDLPAELATAVGGRLAQLAPEIEAAVDADGATVAFNDGEAAGQEVPHVHGHVIPRFEGDGGTAVHGVAGSPPDLDDDELDQIATDIGNRV